MEKTILDNLDFDANFGWYNTKPIKIPFLNDKEYTFVLDNYDPEKDKTDFNKVIGIFINNSKDVLYKAESEIFRYYLDCEEYYINENINAGKIENAHDIWPEIFFGNEIQVSRDYENPENIYLSMECECSWEIEHGLQIVFKNGDFINKIGQYDGHLTNADAYGRPEFENRIYISIKEL